MKVSMYKNKYYILEADEGKVITTVIDPPKEQEERLFTKKIYLGKWDKIENYKEIDETEMITMKEQEEERRKQREKDREDGIE